MLSFETRNLLTFELILNQATKDIARHYCSLSNIEPNLIKFKASYLATWLL